MRLARFHKITFTLWFWPRFRPHFWQYPGNMPLTPARLTLDRGFFIFMDHAGERSRSGLEPLAPDGRRDLPGSGRRAAMKVTGKIPLRTSTVDRGGLFFPWPDS